MKDVVFVLNWWKGSQAGGGAKKFNIEMVDSLRNDYDINGSVLYNRGNDSSEQLIGSSNLSCIWKIFTHLNFHKPKNILIEGGTYFALAALLFKYLRSRETKLIYIFLTYPQNNKKVHVRFLKFLLKTFDKIVFVSKNLEDVFKLYYDYNFHSNTKIIRPAITLNKIKSGGKVSRDKRILVAGLFSSKTNALGCKLILDTFDTLNTEFSDYKITFLGEGRYKEKVVSYAQKTNIKSQIEFRGFVNDVDRYLLSSTLLIYASYGTGSPLTIIEAMSRNCMVLASKCGGIPEMIKHNSEGLLFKNNVEDLSEKLSICLKNPSFRKSLSDNAFKRYSKYYVRKRLGNDFFNLIYV